MYRNPQFRGETQPPGSARRPFALPGDREQGHRSQAEIRAQRGTAPRSSDGLAVDSDSQQDIEDCDLVDITEQVLSQRALENAHGRYRFRQAVRNADLKFSHRQTPAYTFGDIELKPGTCVELRGSSGNWKAQFVEIKSIWVSRSDRSVIIRGLPYTRNRNLGGIMEKKLNEVTQMLEVDTDDRRPAEIQGQIEFSPQEMLRLRTLVKTNILYPKYNCEKDPLWRYKPREVQETQAPLVCRGKLYVQYRDARARRDDKPDHDRAYIRLRQAEADEGKRESDKALRFNWRGKTHLGGSYRPHPSGQGQQYTCGDAFCSAGGTSHGAVMAGFKLVFGVDNCPVACATWRRNFTRALMFEQSIDKWLQDKNIDWRSHPIDILHLSPPCQPFCPHAYSHASAGRVNEAAQAALSACGDIVKQMRSRLLTLEQTFGLTHDTHKGFLNCQLIQAFTSQGYSVRWKVVPLVEYGLPQTRKRLLMIGSCPGEQLPPWPPATHAQRPTGSQEHFVTEAQALQGLSRRDPLHDVAHAVIRHEQPRDGNVPLSKTITGGGSGVSHFSGLRDHTLREIACLQGFPVSHQFEGNKTQIRKQIGNAFPSCVVKSIYDHLRAWLQKVDEVPRAPLAQAEAHRSPAVRPQALPAINGDLTEEEALEFALQESRSESFLAAILVPSVEEDRQDSPVSVVGPLLERMSIAPASHRGESPAEYSLRSRSHTLGRSASPQPSHTAKAASKRSLDSMHDGDADEVMKEESPPKRERVAGNRDSHEGVV